MYYSILSLMAVSPAEILGGPNAADVIAAFAEAYTPTPRYAMFRTTVGGETPVRITGLTYESGAPGMFCFRGYLCDVAVEGFYNCRTGHGYIGTARK